MSRCLLTDGSNNDFTVTPLFNLLEIPPSLTSNSVITQALLSNLWPVETMEEEDHVAPHWVSVSYCLLNVLSFILLCSSLPHFLLLFFFLHTHMFTHSQTRRLQSLTYHICWVNHSIPAFSIFFNVPDTLGLFIKGLKWYQVELKLIQCFQNASCHPNRHRYSSWCDSSP